LDYISEFLKKVTDQEVIVTRIWFSKKMKWATFFEILLSIRLSFS
jgi:hypothetical protein